ncbi:hypothetical protein VTN02DRAFT_535 [Thermoascus thermophilus]
MLMLLLLLLLLLLMVRMLLVLRLLLRLLRLWSLLLLLWSRGWLLLRLRSLLLRRLGCRRLLLRIRLLLRRIAPLGRWNLLGLRRGALSLMHILRLRGSSLLRRLLTRLACIACLVRLLRLLRLGLCLCLCLLHGKKLVLLEIRLPMGHLLLEMHLHVDGAHVGIIRLHGGYLSSTQALGAIWQRNREATMLLLVLLLVLLVLEDQLALPEVLLLLKLL